MILSTYVTVGDMEASVTTLEHLRDIIDNDGMGLRIRGLRMVVSEPDTDRLADFCKEY